MYHTPPRDTRISLLQAGLADESTFPPPDCIARRMRVNTGKRSSSIGPLTRQTRCSLSAALTVRLRAARPEAARLQARQHEVREMAHMKTYRPWTRRPRAARRGRGGRDFHAYHRAGGTGE